MKKIIATAVFAASALTLATASNTASAGWNDGDYATEYCRYYKNRAMYTGSRIWWNRYYACLREYR